MSGAQRLALGDDHDRTAVVPAIEARGYEVEEFGQALLSPAVRERLRHRTSLIRWLPDHAVKVPGARERLALIDSKTCTGRNRETKNHAVEFRSILGALITRIPTFYVCHDLRVLDTKVLYLSLRLAPELYEQAWPCCESCMATFQAGRNELQIADELPEHCPNHVGGGSGTPFVRFPRIWCYSMDRVFPPLAAERTA